MSTAASSKVMTTTFLSLSNSTFSFTILVPTIIALALVHRLVTTFLFSPLRYIPGPPLAALTSLYLLFIDFSGNRTSSIHAWHNRYGPTIRIGPTELSFADIDAVNTIYAQGGPFGKSPSYDQYALPPAGIFAMRDREAHRRRRKLLAPAFAMSSLYEVEPLIMLHVRRLVDHLQRKTSGSVDALLAFRMLSLDVTSELFLGKSFNVLSKVDEHGDLVVPGYVPDVEAFFICTSLQWQFPWALKLVGMLPFKGLQYWLDSGERVCQVGLDAVASRSNVDPQDTKRKNMMTNMIDASKADESSIHSMTDFQIGRELSNMLLAGTGKSLHLVLHLMARMKLVTQRTLLRLPMLTLVSFLIDTTSTSLTYLFWELAKQPSWQARIVSELNATKAELNVSNLPDLTFRQLSELPVLDAVITEALRLHPAAPGSLPRTCADGHAIISGTVVPSGVSCARITSSTT